MYDKFVSSFLKITQWTYMSEMYEVSASTTTSGFFEISAISKKAPEMQMEAGMLKIVRRIFIRWSISEQLQVRIS